MCLLMVRRSYILGINQESKIHQRRIRVGSGKKKRYQRRRTTIIGVVRTKSKKFK